MYKQTVEVLTDSCLSFLRCINLQVILFHVNYLVFLYDKRVEITAKTNSRMGERTALCQISFIVECQNPLATKCSQL